MQHYSYSYFNDHYSAVCYDANISPTFFGTADGYVIKIQWFIMHGLLCDYFSIASFASLDVRVSIFNSSPFNVHEQTLGKQLVGELFYLCSLFVYASKDAAHYLNNRPLCRTLEKYNDLQQRIEAKEIDEVRRRNLRPGSSCGLISIGGEEREREVH